MYTKKIVRFLAKNQSNFASTSYKRMKEVNVKELLKLGCGQGKDYLFFASMGIIIKPLNYSKVAIDAIIKEATNKGLRIKAIACDARSGNTV